MWRFFVCPNCWGLLVIVEKNVPNLSLELRWCFGGVFCRSLVLHAKIFSGPNQGQLNSHKHNIFLDFNTQIIIILSVAGLAQLVERLICNQ